MSRKECGNTDGENILCPLFKAFTDSTIRCESHVPDSNVIEIRYGDTKSCGAQRKLYCEGNWQRCEHYIAWKHLKWIDEE